MEAAAEQIKNNDKAPTIELEKHLIFSKEENIADNNNVNR